MTTVPRNAWLVLLLSACTTGLSWLFYFRALQIGKAAYVAPIDKSSVALVAVLSVLFLHETLTWKAIAGTVAILIGILLFLF